MNASFWTVRRTSLAMGLLAFLSVLLTLGDPGITLDEPLDVRPGRTYVEALVARGWGFFEKQAVDRVFRDNREHPPLGRWLLGIASKLGEPMEITLLGPDPLRPGFYVRSGRLAPAVCFGILVGLIAMEAGRRYGRAGGMVAGFSLAILPRMFAHAHFGALDTFVALFWTLAVLKAIRAIESPRPVRSLAVAGLCWGLILLTKIHGWLLPPVVAAWAFRSLPARKAIPALAAWTLAGLAVFFAGWPWLWYDFPGRLLDYLRTGVDRVPIKVLYFGGLYNDREVPWHYPWFYFAATVPIGLHLLGAAGVVKGWRDRRFDGFPLLLAGIIVGWLALFSTKAPVYDGERLFLPAFPLWAMMIGRGFAWIWDDLEGRTRLRAALAAAVLAQASALVMIHPFGLSYYNSFVGGLWGAERLGLEVTFWGDSVDDVLIDQLARDAQPEASAALAPTLVPNQGKLASNRNLVSGKSIVLGDQSGLTTADWVVVWRREAYWNDEIRALVRTRRPVRVRSRQGVWLSGIWKRH